MKGRGVVFWVLDGAVLHDLAFWDVEIVVGKEALNLLH